MSRRWRKLKYLLFSGWQGVGHLSQAQSIGAWVFRLLPTVAVAMGVISAVQGAWGLTLLVLAIALVVAVFAYFLERPDRPQLVGSIGMVVFSKPPSPPGVLLVLRIVNNGRPTILDRWSAYVKIAGQEHELAVQTIQGRFKNVHSGVVQDVEDLVQKTFNQPIETGHAVVGGIITTNRDLLHQHFEAPGNEYVVTCKDSFGREWEFPGEGTDWAYRNPAKLPIIPGLTDGEASR